MPYTAQQSGNQLQQPVTCRHIHILREYARQTDRAIADMALRSAFDPLRTLADSANARVGAVAD